MRILVLMIILLLSTPPTFGAPFDISVSGRFVGTDGSPQVGIVDVQVKFFSAPTGGSSLGEPVTKTGVQLSSGVFELPLELPPKQFHNIFRDSGDVWIEVTDLTNGRTYPRQKYGAVPYALKIPVDGESLSFNGDGELEVSFPVAGSAKRGSIKATSSYLSVDADGDITSLNADTATSASSFTGSLSGEVTGSQGSTVVSQIMGANVDTVTPSVVNQIIKWDGSKWYAGTDSTVGSGAVDTVNNYGGGQEIMKDKPGSEVRFRTLVGADGLTATTIGDTVEIGVGATSDLAIGSLTTNKQAALVAGPHNTGVGNTGEVRFQELAANGTDSVGFKSPDLLAGNLTWTLPDVAGTAGQSLGLSGAGTLGWIDSNTSGSVQSASVGTVGAPSYTFNGDTDTGLYAIAPDKIGFATAGADRMTIGATGNVGIGSTSPQHSLDVASTDPIIASFESPQAGLPSIIQVKNTATTSTANKSSLDLRANTSTQIRTTGRMEARFTDTTDASRDSRIDFYTALNGTFAERLSIDGDGQVGIGTISPSRQLHIASDIPIVNIQDSAQVTPTLAAPAIEFTTSDNTRIGFMGDGSPTGDIMMVVADTGPVRLTTVAAQPLEFRTASTERMRIDGTGNVGIGTTIPGQLLHLEGAGTVMGRVNSTDSSAGIEFTSDGTGTVQLYSPDATNDLTIVTGGAHRVRLLENGNVGIGTTNPTYDLDVAGNVGIDQFMYHNDDADTYMAFNPNSVDISAGGEVLIKAFENGVQDYVKLGDGGDVDINLNDMMFLEGSTGNVGVGTTIPDKPLTVSSASGQNTPIRLHRQTSTNDDFVDVLLSLNDSGSSVQSYASIQGIIGDSTAGAEDGSFSIRTVRNSTLEEKMRIDSEGNVGIGTTNPSYKLDVVSESSSDSINFQTYTDTGHATFRGRRALGSVGSPGTPVSGDALTSLLAESWDGNSWEKAAQIILKADGNAADGDTPGSIDLRTTPSGTVTPESRLLIQEDGLVGIGTTGPGERVHVTGADFVGLLVEATDADGTARIQVKNDAQEYRFGINNNDKFYIRDETAATNRLTIDTTGNMGLGTASPDADAILELSSTTKGLLPPRMTTAQRDLITTPPKGLVVYNTTTDALNIYDGSWSELGSAGGTGKLLALQESSRTDRVTLSATIPLDNTKPQNTEGTEILTVAITPTSATSILLIEGMIRASECAPFIAALFKDSDADALTASATDSCGYSAYLQNVSFFHKMVAGTTSPITFKVRAGPSENGPSYLNSREYPAASALFGGTNSSYITVKEIAP